MCPGFRTEGLPPAVWRGGESEALERLNKHLDKKVTKAPLLVQFVLKAFKKKGVVAIKVAMIFLFVCLF